MGKLIRLELFNFKSYKGHHTLLFGDSYFTSIIGPNGSGKSNSMDAISFVLGIKSSHLRSTHLKDLVYRGRVLKTATINEDGSATVNDTAETNGTQERNDPKSAWVMAVYEDDDGEEIQWKRTITNQGTSEYRINNSVVTAQRYNEALEEENILIKARNFLVFQGDVEAIASQSPKDLTRLIEQISGSLEYKADYEKLKEEMDTANENQAHHFNRRRTVNSEIKQYQAQKQEADNYANKVDERDQAIVTHILWKLYQFQRVIEESEAEILKHQEELKEHKRGVAKFEASLETAKKAQAKASRDVSKVERTIKAKEKEVEVKENSLIPIKEKVHLTGDRQEKTRSRIQTIAKERDSKSELIKKLQKDLKVVEKAETQWETEWSKVAQQEGRVLSDADLQEYNKLREDSSKQSADEQIKLDTLTRQVRAEQETLNSLQNQLESLEQSKSQISSEAEGYERTKAELTETVETIQGEIAAKKKSYNSLLSERTRVDQLKNELDEKLADVGKKIIDAEEGRRQSEKERRMRTTVADMKRIYPNVRGRFSELCKPKQKKFGEAISVVLGRHMDSIIVDEEKTARDCIQYLKDQNLGQASFIPLDTIVTKPVNAGLKGIAKGTRLALDTIDFDSSLERAMLYACGNALVCDDEKTAKHICFEKNVDAKVVTLEGIVYHKGGLITGGRGNDQPSSRWEDTDVEGFRKLAQKYKDDLANLPPPRGKAGEEEALQADLSQLESRLEYTREELKALERNLASKKTELTHANAELKKLKPQLDAKGKDFAALKKQLEAVQKTVSTVEDKIFRDFCKRLGYADIRAYEAAQGSLMATASQKRLEFKQQKSRLESRLSFEMQQLNETKARIDNLEEQVKRDAAHISSLEQERQSISNESDVLMAEIETVREELSSLNKELDVRNDKVSEERRKLEKRNASIQGTVKEVSAREAEMQTAGSERYALLRKCKLDGITIPLEDDSNGLDHLPIDGVQLGVVDTNEDTMDVDGGDVSTSQRDVPQIDTFGILVNFDELDDDLKESTDPKYEETLTSKITSLNDALSHLAPNMQATNHLDAVQSRLAATEAEFEAARITAKQSRDKFNAVAGKRTGLFNKAFAHISERIGPIYAELTSSTSLPLGGQAYLDLEDSDEPFLSGLKYHAMPPLKRFRDMEHLSGGEKTIAALALLFAIHSFQPSPFFVLDEVDAALDNANVGRIAGYIEKHRGPGMQFIVISLKSGLFERSESLVGVHRDQGANSSRVLTLDLRKYA